MFHPASRMEALPFSEIRVMMEKATQMQKNGEDVIHMEIGRPDFDTPRSSRRPPTRLWPTATCFTPPTTVPPNCARLSPTS